MNKITSYLHELRFGIAQGVRIGGILAILFGLLMLGVLSAPMLMHNYKTAGTSWVGERSYALYDLGLQLYQAEEFKEAVKTFNDAYNLCLGPQGVVEGDKRALAAEIKFLAGNALVKDKQLSKAIEAYKECLRIDPNHLHAKYNLEKLQSMNGGKGPSPADEPDAGKPGKGNKRGI